MRAEGAAVARATPRPLPAVPYFAVLLAIAAAAAWSVHRLGLAFGDLLPGRGGLELAGDFFSRALAPAVGSESPAPVAGASPLIVRALGAAHHTVVFAAAAVSLALPISLPLAVLGSTAFWEADPVAAGGGRRRRWLGAVVFSVTRALIAALRSVHELLWAVLFLAAFGLTPVSAVVAIAIPFTGCFAKVFSEVLDETPRDAADALRGCGASALQVFLVALLPRALADMEAYTFYRFECAVRSSTILGFFGLPTLGFFIATSFENLYFGEVWTYLYTLFALVVALEWWSGAVRRRLAR